MYRYIFIFIDLPVPPVHRYRSFFGCLANTFCFFLLASKGNEKRVLAITTTSEQSSGAEVDASRYQIPRYEYELPVPQHLFNVSGFPICASSPDGNTWNKVWPRDWPFWACGCCDSWPNTPLSKSRRFRTQRDGMHHVLVHPRR